ncbi:MAG TPA: o-succinylbenzoate synthase [Blastocatellia bacterium]|nr:o-succinylbenzoate synthase [Blastocatellia bacterium]
MDLHLDRLELREIEIPLRSPFETSFGRTSTRRIMLVKIYDSSGAVGYGECTASEEPFFNHECVDTAWVIVAKFAAPLLASARVAGAPDVPAALARIRGNRMAIAGVETAVWDLQARIAGEPLWRHLGGTREVIDCGVSIGLQDSIGILLDKVSAEVAAGYQRIKLKIKPGRDLELVAAVRSEFPSIKLSVDANSAYTLADIDVLKELDRFKLLMIEQPLAAGDLVDHSKLQPQLETDICLDESIVSLDDARQAIDLGACRIINIKLGRVGGHAEAKKIQEYALRREIPVWCGGMLESGIGRAHNIAMSTLPAFSLPGDVSASKRYWQEDIIEPPVTVSACGTIHAPSGLGIGYSVNEERIEALTVRREDLRL